MLGAIIGDIVGSRFEFNNHRSKDFDLFDTSCFVTDDSIMTLAIAEAILACEGDWKKLGNYAANYMQIIGRKYPNCGYGSMFGKWIFSNDPKPYNSFGNGAAMRVSPCGFVAQTENEAKMLSKIVTEVTHNHPEGIKGAEAVVIAIFMARNGASKDDIKKRIENEYYQLDFTLVSIRQTYKFDATCQNTVPQAIQAFLESNSFEDAIRNAISIGGDSDTIAAITGGIAEAFYGIPVDIKAKAQIFINSELRSIYKKWNKDIILISSKKKSLFFTNLKIKLENLKLKIAALFFGKINNKKNKDSDYKKNVSLRRLKPDEVIYCGVVFSDYGQIYHYRTTDTKIKEGDIVIVPVGIKNYEKKATVETIEICSKDNTPFPLERTKEVIRLIDEDEDDYDDDDYE